MSITKNIIKKWLRQMGYALRPIGKKYMYEQEVARVRYDWLKPYEIKTVIDVGACIGQFATRARNMFPEAHILSFEPLVGSYNTLSERFLEDFNFESFNVALGSKPGKATFNHNNFSDSSSLLELTDLHRESFPFATDVTVESVNIDTLDNMLCGRDLQKNIMLKLDVQGFEKQVLIGAEQVLSETNVVYLEVAFSPLYQGQPVFNEMTDFMYRRGFAVRGIEGCVQSIIDGRFLQADVYFIRD